MTKPLRVDREAEEELAEAVTWYEENKPGLGREFLDAIEEAQLDLSEGPALCSLAPGIPKELVVRRILVRRFPYAVVFLELPEEIRVLAFAHARRRPGYWRDRRSTT